MITQQYFCDKCKKEIVEGEYVFHLRDLEIFRITKSQTGNKQERIENFSGYMREKEMYCKSCIGKFFNIPTDEELETRRKSKRYYQEIEPKNLKAIKKIGGV